MQIDEMRTHLTTLKLYMKKMEEFVSQAGTMIYEVEERLMDLEDDLYFQKYESKNSIKKLNGAATQTFGPPRLGIDRCSEDDIQLAAFVQEFSYMNQLINARS